MQGMGSYAVGDSQVQSLIGNPPLVNSIVHIHAFIGHSRLLIVQRSGYRGKWQSPSEGVKSVDIDLRQTGKRCLEEELSICVPKASIIPTGYCFFGVTSKKREQFKCHCFYTVLQPSIVCKIKLNPKELCDFKVLSIPDAIKHLARFGYGESVASLMSVFVALPN